MQMSYNIIIYRNKYINYQIVRLIYRNIVDKQ